MVFWPIEVKNLLNLLATNLSSLLWDKQGSGHTRQLQQGSPLHLQVKSPRFIPFTMGFLFNRSLGTPIVTPNSATCQHLLGLYILEHVEITIKFVHVQMVALVFKRRNKVLHNLVGYVVLCVRPFFPQVDFEPVDIPSLSFTERPQRYPSLDRLNRYILLEAKPALVGNHGFVNWYVFLHLAW